MRRGPKPRKYIVTMTSGEKLEFRGIKAVAEHFVVEKDTAYDWVNGKAVPQKRHGIGRIVADAATTGCVIEFSDGRKEKFENQKAAADYIGCYQPELSSWFNGKHKPQARRGIVAITVNGRRVDTTTAKTAGKPPKKHPGERPNKPVKEIKPVVVKPVKKPVKSKKKYRNEFTASQIETMTPAERHELAMKDIFEDE